VENKEGKERKSEGKSARIAYNDNW